MSALDSRVRIEMIFDGQESMVQSGRRPHVGDRINVAFALKRAFVLIRVISALPPPNTCQSPTDPRIEALILLTQILFGCPSMANEV